MKITRHTLSLAVLLAAFMLVVGCSDDSSVATNPDTQQATPTDDDYQILAEDIAYAITNPEDGMLVLWRPVPPMEGEGPGGGEPQADHFRDFSNLHDTTFTHRGFTTTIDVTFFDVDDNQFQLYDPETSVRLLRYLTMNGEHSDDFREVVVDLQSMLTMDNILEIDTVHVINEEATRSEIGEMQGRHEDHIRTWDAFHEWVTTDLNVHVDHETYPYPLSGQVYNYTIMERTRIDGHATHTEIIEVGSTITFDGTNMALVEMDNGDTFYINLDDGGHHRRPPRP